MSVSKAAKPGHPLITKATPNIQQIVVLKITKRKRLPFPAQWPPKDQMCSKSNGILTAVENQLKGGKEGEGELACSTP